MINGKILCVSCKKACKGSVLKVQDNKYFHIECFKCHKCKANLGQSGFFFKDGKYYCSTDYQTLYGTKCEVCKAFVQGEVVTALGKTYHQKCFACFKCKNTFIYGEKVIYTKNQCICTSCFEVENLNISPSQDKKDKKIKKDKNNNTTKSSLPLQIDKKVGIKKSDKSKESKNSQLNSSKTESKSVNQKDKTANDKIDLNSCAGCNGSLSKPASILHQHQPRSSSRQSGRSVQIKESKDRPKTPVNTADNQATLFALNRNWHESCFRCSTCETPLFNKEYMTSKPDPNASTKDSVDESKLVDSPEHQMTAHCITCYKAKLSIRCSYCSRIIEGKVLQAGDLHFHPSCCRCFKCGFLFTHAQEMFVQGKAIWHAHCEGLRFEQLESHYSPFTRSPRSRSMPRSQPSLISPYDSLYQIHRTQHISPASLDHHNKLHSLAVDKLYRDRGHTLPTNMSPLSTMHSYSYLTNTEPNTTYLRKPLQPQNSNSPQYHLPSDYPYRSRSNFSRSSSATRSSPNLMSGMRAMVDSLRPHYRSISPSERSIRRQQAKTRKAVKARITSTTNTSLEEDQLDKELKPADKSQQSDKQSQDQPLDDISDDSSNLKQQLLDGDNEEVIELSTYPPARRPNPDEVLPIERDDFPGKPFPLNVSRASHRSSSRVRPATTTKTMNSNGNTSEDEAEEEKVDDLDLESDESDPLELARKQHLHDQIKREELELEKMGHGIGEVFLSNLKEREKRIREYRLDPRNSSRVASARLELPRRLRYDNPVNASPSRDLDQYKNWDDEELDQYSLYRSSNTRSSNYTAPFNIVSSTRSVPKPGYSLKKDNTNYTYNSNNLEKTQSIDFNCGKSDISAHSELERNYINRSISGYGLSPYSDLYRVSLMRNSMPNVSLHKSNEPPKLYPYHLLIITNYRLPPDVDRCHLEAHLSNEEFESLFQMSRLDFYRLPEWKRNELKKRVKLF